MIVGRRRPTDARTAAALIFVLLLGLAAAPSGAQSERDLRDRATDLAYNLDYDQAIDLMRQAIARAPQDSPNHRVLAAVVWQRILFERGAVTVDHYLGGLSRERIELKAPPPQLDEEFRRQIARAIELAEQHVARAPQDPEAHDDLGAALGLQATYIASVEGRLLGGFRVARRGYEEEERVLELDPRRKDAELIIGTYRYIISTLSLPMRLMAYVVGFGGGKEKGIEMIEDCAASSADNRTDAQFALVLLYNREHRYDAAMRVLEALRRRYPRNRLILLEEGATASRAGKAAEAEGLLTEGIERLNDDKRPRIPGELSLWHLKRGTARVMLGRHDGAAADLRIATDASAPAWVRGRGHVQLAQLAMQEGNARAARQEASIAVADCQKGNDQICIDDAKKLGGR